MSFQQLLSVVIAIYKQQIFNIYLANFFVIFLTYLDYVCLHVHIDATKSTDVITMAERSVTVNSLCVETSCMTDRSPVSSVGRASNF